MATADLTTGFEGPDEEIEFDLEREADDGEGGVEVELSDEDAGDAEESEAEAPKPEEPQEPAKPKYRADARVQSAVKRAAEAEARAAAAEQERELLRQQLAERERGEYRALESGLTAELATAQRKLADAHTLGDSEAIAAATVEVTRLAADLSAVKAYTAAPQKANTPQEQQRQEQQQQLIEPRTQAWIAENPWFVPSSPDYDPELAVEAQAFAKKLEIRAHREGRANYIGSDDYFNQINEHMARTYPDFFELEAAPPAKKVPAMTADKTVAPVQRQDPAMKPKPKSNSVRLTAEQKDMAERMAPHLPPQQAWLNYAKYL